MSTAVAAPAVKAEVKFVGSVSRSAIAWTTAAAVPLIAVIAAPFIVPAPPLAASSAVMAVAAKTPVRVALKLAGVVKVELALAAPPDSSTTLAAAKINVSCAAKAALAPRVIENSVAYPLLGETAATL